MTKEADIFPVTKITNSFDPPAETYEGLGIVVAYDPLTRRSEEKDNVLPILHEEHVVTWKLLGDAVLSAVCRPDSHAQANFLDVGTGSGIWPILVRKVLQRKRLHCPPDRFIAVDKVLRMIEATRKNMRLNALDPDSIELEYAPYSEAAAPLGGVRAVFMNPPYHIYPQEAEPWVPHHARGGPHGFEEFENWLRVANGHLAPEGTLFFHHMCLGDAQGPRSLRFLREHIEGVVSITMHDILPPHPTRKFLAGVYDDAYSCFVDEVSREYPFLYFTSGMLRRRLGFQGDPKIHRSPVDAALLAGRAWRDRIQLHRRIADRE